MTDQEADPDMEFNRQLGERLRTLRIRRRLTLQEVERQSDGAITEAVLGSYERGKRTPPVRRLIQLAAFYGVPVEAVLHGLAEEPRVADADRGTATFDLPALGQAADEAKLLSRFVHNIQRIRQDWATDVVTVRNADMITLSAVYGVSLPNLWREMARWGVLAGPR